jgi:hypothetical protein
MSKIIITTYKAKIIISQLILLIFALSLLLYVSILREKEFKKNFINEISVKPYIETYPTEPKLEDCEKMQTSRINFCFADVAEITNNITLCEKIFDSEIKNFCVAKVMLNSTKCLDIYDTSLKESCLESITMKTGSR